MSANETKTTQQQQTAMMLDLALGNGGKASKAVRTQAALLIAAAFAQNVDAQVLEASKNISTKNTSTEIVALYQTLVALF